MSDAIGPRRNYWEWAAKELEEEKQMLLQQVSALTTKRDNLIALMGELRKAVEEAETSGRIMYPDGSTLTGICPLCECKTTGSDGSLEQHDNDCRIGIALARTPEQVEARRRAEQTVLGVARRWRDDASVWPELQMVIDDLAALEGYRTECDCSEDHYYHIGPAKATEASE